MNERDELASVFAGHPVGLGSKPAKLMKGHAQEIAEKILAAGYRKIFDGDCGLSLVDDADKEASEAWMRWSNLVLSQGTEPNGITAMKQMLAEFGYRRPQP